MNIFTCVDPPTYLYTDRDTSICKGYYEFEEFIKRNLVEWRCRLVEIEDRPWQTKMVETGNERLDGDVLRDNIFGSEWDVSQSFKDHDEVLYSKYILDKALLGGVMILTSDGIRNKTSSTHHSTNDIINMSSMLNRDKFITSSISGTMKGITPDKIIRVLKYNVSNSLWCYDDERYLEKAMEEVNEIAIIILMTRSIRL